MQRRSIHSSESEQVCSATRLPESGCDIVTVQRLMGHSDLETTRQYLNPDEDLKRKAVNRLRL